MTNPTSNGARRARTRTTQTTTIAGKRVRLVTTPSGIRVTDAPVLEWRLQAEAVRQMRDMSEYAATASQVREGTFTLAGDFNAGRRGMQESVKAKATGLTAGEPDARIYAASGRLLLIEYKNADGRLSGDQVDRHALLRALGYTIEVIKASTPEECATRSVSLVRSWLSAPTLAAYNDNAPDMGKDSRRA